MPDCGKSICVCVCVSCDIEEIRPAPAHLVRSLKVSVLSIIGHFVLKGLQQCPEQWHNTGPPLLQATHSKLTCWLTKQLTTKATQLYFHYLSSDYLFSHKMISALSIVKKKPHQQFAEPKGDILKLLVCLTNTPKLRDIQFQTKNKLKQMNPWHFS